MVGFNWSAVATKEETEGTVPLLPPESFAEDSGDAFFPWYEVDKDTLFGRSDPETLDKRARRLLSGTEDPGACFR